MKTALVTGGSSGIGRDIVIRLAKEGYRVVTCARRINKLEALRTQLHSQGYVIYPFQTDLKSEKSIHQLFKEIRNQFGGIDVLVNSAAVGHKAPLSNAPTKLWREMLAVNVLALCICSREVIKELSSSKSRGHIINISSLSGHRLASEGGMYEATKFAVTAITESLRRELLSTNGRIKVTQISPGLVKTGFHEKYYKSLDAAESIYTQFTPLNSTDIAEVVVFVLSQPENVQINDILMRPVGQLA